MTGMSQYYISRAFISLAFGGIFALAGSPWWMAVLMGVMIFAFFLWAPRSRRYADHPEHGVTALRRDERTQAINDKAARNGFIVVALAVAANAIYFGSVAGTDVPVLALNVIRYFVT